MSLKQKKGKNLSSDQTLRLQPYRKPSVGELGSGLGPAVCMLWRYCSQVNQGHRSLSPHAQLHCDDGLSPWEGVSSLGRRIGCVSRKERNCAVCLCCVTRAVSTPNSKKKKKKDSWINSYKTKSIGRIAEVHGDRSNTGQDTEPQ